MGLLIDHFDLIVRPLLQALLNSFWQGIIITVLVWLLLRVFRKASATTRHAVWLVSLLTIGMLPLIALHSMRGPSSMSQPEKQEPSTEMALPVPMPETNPPAVEGQVSLIGPPYGPARTLVITDYERAAQKDETAKIVTLDESSKAVPKTVSGNIKKISNISAASGPGIGAQYFRQGIQANLFNGRIPSIIVGAWLIGCFLMLSRIARSSVLIFRLRRRLEFVGEQQRERVRHLAEIFGIKRPVEVFTYDEATVPMTIGAFRPFIILPSGLDRNLSAAEFESVIAHELAHIKRWDYLTNFLQRLAQAFLFFHPAVWLISKHLMIERELACDDWAVKTCEPRRYACCLTKLVELLSNSKPFITATGILFGKHVISRRVEMILNRDRNATTAVSKPALVYAIGMAVIFVCICSSISPVIAVPLAQEGAAKQQTKKENKARTNAPSKPQEPAPVTLPTGPTPEPPIDVPELVDFPEVPLPPPPPVAVIVEPDEEPLLVPETPLATMVITPLVPIAPSQSFSWQQPTPAPRVARVRNSIGQDDKSKTPAISESELLGVLTDIVKRDTDPSVRNEALQGIYRMRSDAAINTLIQLYDGTSDVKVKGEIIAYLLRRNGDNSKAIAKLMTIAKSDPSEELRAKAIRYLGGVKGDEGAGNLIQIYDGLQDSKMKQTVIRYMAYNRSRKAVDKLIQIAKNDTDPAVRQAAIRSLYGIDSRLYLEFVDGARPKIGLLNDQLRRLEHDKFNGKIIDLKQLQQLQDKMQLEFPQMELDLQKFQMEWEDKWPDKWPELKWPELKRKIEEKEKTRPKLQRSANPTPQAKPSRVS